MLFWHNIIYGWNDYVIELYTHTTHTTYTTQQYEEKKEFLEIKDSVLSVYNKIVETKITGRNLELFFPLFLVANTISRDTFENILSISTNIVSQQKEDDAIESIDVSLIEFVSVQHNDDYILIKELTEIFRIFLGDTDKEDLWLNTKWMGRALKRLSLIKEKRRVGKGIEVILDVIKAKEKIKMFK